MMKRTPKQPTATEGARSAILELLRPSLMKDAPSAPPRGSQTIVEPEPLRIKLWRWGVQASLGIFFAGVWGVNAIPWKSVPTWVLEAWLGVMVVNIVLAWLVGWPPQRPEREKKPRT